MNPNPECEQTINPECEPVINPECEPMINPECEPTINPECEPTINPECDLRLYVYNKKKTLINTPPILCFNFLFIYTLMHNNPQKDVFE